MRLVHFLLQLLSGVVAFRGRPNFLHQKFRPVLMWPFGQDSSLKETLKDISKRLDDVTSEVAAVRLENKDSHTKMTKVCSALEELSSDLGRTAESTIRATLQQSHSVSFPNSYDVYDLETLIRLLEPRYTDAAEIDEDYLTVAKCMVVSL